jgi:hypothetical protein
MGESLPERIRGKLTGQGLDDLLMMIENIRPQDGEALQAEAEALAAQLLALAAERPPELAELAPALVSALSKAARTIQPDAAPDTFFFMGEGEEGDGVTDFLIADLMGLGHQLAAATDGMALGEDGQRVRQSARMMTAASILLVALGGEADPENERFAAWLQLATVEGILRRFQALLTQSMEGHAVGCPRNDEDRWATAAVILSGTLSGMAEVIRVERARQENDLAWDLDPQGWMRLVVHILRDSAERIAPTVESPEPSPLVAALGRLAEVWEGVAGADDGEAAIRRATVAPSWERVWRGARTE